MKSGSAAITVAAPVEVVWDAVAGQGRRRWYFRLTPEGEFAPGKKIRWLDGGSTVAEESEVVEVKPLRQLVLRTKFLFSPTFAKQHAHTVTWQLTRSGKKTRLRLSWEAPDIVAGMFESEAANILQALQLEHDAGAQAANARLETVGDITVQDVTPERIADYHTFFDKVGFRDNPAWQSCYCMETHRTQSDEEWAARTAAENRRDMSRMIEEGGVTGLLAYVDGKPVGWCNYGETTHLNGVMHRFGLNAGEQQGVGSLACFVIAAPYRKHGVASKLLDAALERLRARGVRVAEAYPSRNLDSPQANYRGPLQMFLRAGFEPYRETGRNVIVRKQL